MTILRGIVSVVVPSLYLLPIRAFAHICEEIFEPFPAIANAYSASAIIGVIGRATVVAATSDAAPDPISAGRLAAAVAAIQIPNLFGAQTSARFRVAAPKVWAADFCFASAIASCEEHRPGLSRRLSMRWQRSDDRQSPESLPDMVNAPRHGFQ